jgi:hypothetical protein
MSLSMPVLVGALLFVWTVWAVLFWGSIAIVERYNPYNRFGWALIWSTAELIVSFAMGTAGFAGLGILLVWLVFLMRLLLGRYELGMLHALGVVIVTVVGPYFVADAFVKFVGSSETMFMLVLYGVPLAVGLVWLWPRPAPAPPTNLPAARVERFRRKRGAADIVAASPDAPAPAAASPGVPAAGPAPAPIRTAPVAAVAPIVPTVAVAVAVAPPPIVPLAPLAPPIVAPATTASPASDAPRDVAEPSFLR